MKAVTIAQPLATLAARGVVTILTRDKPAPDGLIGERIALASDGEAAEDGQDWGEWSVRDDVVIHLPTVKMMLPEHRTLGVLFPEDAAGHEALPLGSVVGSARLAACLPIFDNWDFDNIWINTEHCIQIGRNPFSGEIETFYEWGPGETVDGFRKGGGGDEDQVSFSDFSPGRWAWMLEDAAPCEPILWRGQQRLWNLPDRISRVLGDNE